MKEKIAIVYKILIYNLDLTDEELMKQGLHRKDIRQLINKKVIRPSSNGIYDLVSVDDLRKYGIEMLEQNRRFEAIRCFSICYKLSPDNKKVCLQYMLIQLQKKTPDYEKIFEIFANLEKISPKKSFVNNNLYLYLFSYITDCPKEYADRIRSFEGDEYMLSDNYDHKVENEIRQAIQKHKFLYAYSLVNKVIEKGEHYSVKFLVIKELLSRVIDNEKKYKKDLLEFATTGKYHEIVKMLKARQAKRDLSNLEMCILLVAEAIVDFLNSKIIPVATIDTTKDLYSALVGKNFILAQELNEKFLIRKDEDKNKDVINILLIDLNKMISERKENYMLEGQRKLQQDVLDADYWVDYILSENITIDEAQKNWGLNLETVLMIKLAYVMNCYGYRISDKNCYQKYSKPSEEKINEANFILQEVEVYEDKSDKVVSFLNEVKSYDNQGKKKVLS